MEPRRSSLPALAWLNPSAHKAPHQWTAVLIALLIVPSHLVWKPYFVFSIPVAILALVRVIQARSYKGGALLGLIFLSFNFTGFDFLGGTLAGYLESASLFLLNHLILIAFIW